MDNQENDVNNTEPIKEGDSSNKTIIVIIVVVFIISMFALMKNSTKDTYDNIKS